MDSDTFTMKVYRAKLAEMQSLIVSHKIVHHLNYIRLYKLSFYR